MKRIAIIGCPGAGKSTFARRLAAKTGLPLHYLDMIWHRPDRTTIDTEDFDEQLLEIMKADEWILDGNYLRTMPMRLERCDTVFMFDLPLSICLAGAKARLGKDREDMPWTDTEIDPEFLQWILNFPDQQLPLINTLLDNYKNEVRIIRFKTREEADSFLDKL